MRWAALWGSSPAERTCRLQGDPGHHDPARQISPPRTRDFATPHERYGHPARKSTRRWCVCVVGAGCSSRTFNTNKEWRRFFTKPEGMRAGARRLSRAPRPSPESRGPPGLSHRCEPWSQPGLAGSLGRSSRGAPTLVAATPHKGVRLGGLGEPPPPPRKTQSHPHPHTFSSLSVRAYRNHTKSAAISAIPRNPASSRAPG